MSTDAKPMTSETSRQSAPAKTKGATSVFTLPRASGPVQFKDVEYRKEVIKAICEPANSARKEEAIRRYELLKDNVLRYVQNALIEEMDGYTAKDMLNRASSIPFTKKIIKKKARVYKSTVRREVKPTTKPTDQSLVQKAVNGLKRIAGVEGGEEKLRSEQIQLDQLEEALGLDALMKKVNRVTELQKNGLVKIIPCVNHDGKYSIRLTVLHPHQYDVIEDANDPERPIAIILSYYSRSTPSMIDGFNGVRPAKPGTGTAWRDGQGKETKIAGAPVDEGATDKPYYIWWTPFEHFVTDGAGVVVQDLGNPIGELPFADVHIDQDGSFWAVGGDDLPETDILLNVLLTDLNFTMKYQGSGQMYIKGAKIPSTVQIGPNRVLRMEYSEGEPEPEVGFATSSPAIGDMLSAIEEQVGLLLTANDLEVNSVSGKISAGAAASGIQEVIQRSDVVGAIEDEQAIYRKAERDIIRISIKWLNYLKANQAADKTLDSIGAMNAAMEVTITYEPPEVYVSEKERLETLKLRKEIGLDTLEDMIRRDNPDLSEEEVQAKAAKIEAAKKANAEAFGVQPKKPGEPPVPGKKDGEEDTEEDDSEGAA